jgi:hypothetical protein
MAISNKKTGNYDSNIECYYEKCCYQIALYCYRTILRAPCSIFGLSIVFVFFCTCHSLYAQIWKRVTDSSEINDEIAFTRDASGTLHTAFRFKEETKYGIGYRAITPSGNFISSTSKLFNDWESVTNPSIISLSNSSLKIFLSGIRSLTPSDPYAGGNLYAITSGTAQTDWVLDSSLYSQSQTVYASSVVSSYHTSDTRSYHTWSTTSGVFFKSLSEGDEFTANTGGCCGYFPQVTQDSVSGEVYTAWYSNVTARQGLYIQKLFPVRNIEQYVPLSGNADKTAAIYTEQRTPLTNLVSQSGVYTAYCSGYPVCDTVLAWRYGSPDPIVVSSQERNARFVNISKAPDNRIWVVWTKDGKIFTTRSNRALTKFNKPSITEAPVGTSSLWKLSGEGSFGPLDIFVNATVNGIVNTFHTQILPSFTVQVEQLKRRSKKSCFFEYTIKVTDSEDPIPGALIQIDTKLFKTGESGVARIKRVTNKKTVTITVGREGYASQVLKYRFKN